MEELKVYLVDSFTEKQFKGNPAGVVLFADKLRDYQMLKIAQELKATETVYLYKLTEKENHYQVRYFTNIQEIDYCGHATLALAWILAENYPNFINNNKVVFITNVGKVTIKYDYVNGILNNIFIKQIEPRIKEYTGSIKELIEIFILHEQDIDNRFPIKLVYTGNWDLLLPIKNKETIETVYPNIEKLKKHNEFWNVASTHLFCIQKDVIITRNFGPSVGIDEDPVTGSTNGSLVGYFNVRKIFTVGENEIKIIQVNSFSREGLLYVKTKINDDKIEVFVGGKVVKVLEGTIFLSKGEYI